MTVRWIAPLVVSALIGCASGPEPEYALVQADATIPFGGQTVRNFSVGPEDTLILQASGKRLYRAELDPFCRSLLRSEHAIGLEESVTSQIDRFSSVVINGHKCHLRSLDQVSLIKAPA